ncbi:hypothetical protein M0R04_08210 [Candidatus Dojkabacteria bacterium]|jgi:hypothetical protein|nr:hypothetical protein [Candidatus Dojkabacteria bacterium]
MDWSSPFERKQRKAARRKAHPLKTMQAQRKLEAKREAAERKKELAEEKKQKKKLAKIEARIKKNEAIARERESVIRRRQATAKSKKLHPLVKALGGGHKKGRKKKAWWE